MLWEKVCAFSLRFCPPKAQTTLTVLNEEIDVMFLHDCHKTSPHPSKVSDQLIRCAHMEDNYWRWAWPSIGCVDLFHQVSLVWHWSYDNENQAYSRRSWRFSMLQKTHSELLLRSNREQHPTVHNFLSIRSYIQILLLLSLQRWWERNAQLISWRVMSPSGNIYVFCVNLFDYTWYMVIDHLLYQGNFSNNI